MNRPERSPLRLAWQSALLLLALPCLMGAQIYRWVDENGVVNYTQKPPVGVESQAIDSRTITPSSSEVPPAATALAPAEAPDTDLTEDQQAMLDDLRQAEVARQEEVEKIRSTNCAQARSTLERLQARGRIRVRDGNSERVMGEDERQQRIADAQEGVAVNCDA